MGAQKGQGVSKGAGLIVQKGRRLKGARRFSRRVFFCSLRQFRQEGKGSPFRFLRQEGIRSFFAHASADATTGSQGCRPAVRAFCRSSPNPPLMAAIFVLASPAAYGEEAVRVCRLFNVRILSKDIPARTFTPFGNQELRSSEIGRERHILLPFQQLCAYNLYEYLQIFVKAGLGGDGVDCPV